MARRQLSMRAPIAGATLAALLLAGCTVGPNYVAPKPALPAAFVEASSASQTTAAPDAWWTVFGDATLDRLMDQALQGAPDLAEAEARVREARALRGVTAADQLPTVDAGGAYDRNHGSANVPIGVPPGGLGPGVDSDLWQAGFDAAWEIDVFGGVRRAVQSADAAVQAAVADRADVLLSLRAEIARNYMELRGAQQRLAVARDDLALEQDTLGLTRSQFAAGLTSNLDVLRAQAQVSDTQAQIPTLEADERAAIYRIGALVGRPPEELRGELDAPAPIPSKLIEVPVGLPSDLLLRRPDVRAAERRIAAANARIGVAKADLYPRFSLTGVAGLESLNSGTLFDASSRYLMIGPSVSWTVFDAGRIRFRVKAEEARTAEASAAYQRRVLGALRDVETALVAYGRAQVRRRELADEAAADRKSVDLAKDLYRQGVEDFLPVLDAERSLSAVDDHLAESDRDTAVALVALYKALGGGWRPPGRD